MTEKPQIDCLADAVEKLGHNANWLATRMDAVNLKKDRKKVEVIEQGGKFKIIAKDDPSKSFGGKFDSKDQARSWARASGYEPDY